MREIYDVLGGDSVCLLGYRNRVWSAWLLVFDDTSSLLWLPLSRKQWKKFHVAWFNGAGYETSWRPTSAPAAVNGAHFGRGSSAAREPASFIIVIIIEEKKEAEMERRGPTPLWARKRRPALTKNIQTRLADCARAKRPRAQSAKTETTFSSEKEPALLRNAADADSSGWLLKIESRLSNVTSDLSSAPILRPSFANDHLFSNPVEYIRPSRP